MRSAAASATRVGVVGAGQLALMMAEAAPALGVELWVLAAGPDEPAVARASGAVIGSPRDEGALRELAAAVEVVTFDHELVDLELLGQLEASGVRLRPGPRALRFAVDKAHQRRRLRDAGIAVPRFVVVPDEPLEPFLSSLSGPPVVKNARGGYDGRGVYFPDTYDEARRVVHELSDVGDVVVEERLELLGEAAQSIAVALDGTTALYPLVTTVQRDGLCTEVRYPSDLNDELTRSAAALSERVAAVAGAIGIMAIEFFATSGGLVVNEVALRPHNSGHWTIEGAATGQFAQHLRAVSGRPLGPTTPLAPYVAMVNVVGSEVEHTRGPLAAGLYGHDYAKSWRPGRKLGHVTALDDDATRARVRAWEGARAWGTCFEEDA